MSEKSQSYVGVSGVVSPSQQETLRRMALTLESVGRKVALGVKAVHKTQWLDIENRYGPDWYPVGETITSALRSGNPEGEMRVAQVFMDLHDAEEAGVEKYEKRFMQKLMGRTGLWLDAVQFDMLPWHERDYRELFETMIMTKPDLEIILQCQGPIMRELSPSHVMKRLELYRQHVSYVLFDASHGTGRELDVPALRPYVAAASDLDWLSVGVAGGLNEKIVSRQLPELLADFPDVSFDAEGELHLHEDESDKSLNMCAVRNYLLASADAIRDVQ